MKGLEKLEWSALATIGGILILFSLAVGVTLIAPSFIDPSWRQPSSIYQVQMYEVSDPHVYVGMANPKSAALQYVYHLKEGFSLVAYQEGPFTKIISDSSLAPYITRHGDQSVKLTTRILLLRKPENREEALSFQKTLQGAWREKNPDQEIFPQYEILELYDPGQREVFAVTETDGVMEHWAEKDFTILGDHPPYLTQQGVIFIKNPKEFRVAQTNYRGQTYWLYSEQGASVQNLAELQGEKLKFLSRQSLISMGEDIYRCEGCWYCHTDQTRTLVQDTVLNGSEEYPAPPSSANEYIFQKVTFAGTRRIGPDLSRVGIKRPSRDWHMSHFWSPRTESRGSLMPSFKHFFDNDPTGTSRNPYGIPNYKFESIYHYLMTKGTRITSPHQAWWQGKDPVKTIDIIEGKR